MFWLNSFPTLLLERKTDKSCPFVGRGKKSYLQSTGSGTDSHNDNTFNTLCAQYLQEDPVPVLGQLQVLLLSQKPNSRGVSHPM